jgi:hypothetical protein
VSNAGTTIGFLAVGWSALLTATLPLAAEEPVYVKQLDLPVAEDSIGYPQSVTADLTANEIFVCDSRQNRIAIFDGEGLFRYQIHGGRTFSSPTDLAVDRDGFLFVLANHDRRRTLIELDFDGLFRREVVLSGLPEEMLDPDLGSVAISPSGDRFYLLDSANLVLWIAERGGRILDSIDLGSGLSENERIDLILGKVDVYGDRLVLAVPFKGEIRLFDLDGEARGRYGRKGTGPCQLGFPTAAALDEEGNLVIVDQQRMHVMRWDIRTDRCIGEYYGIGSDPGYLYYPLDLALDGSGRIYVTQGFKGRVQMFKGFAPAARPVATEPAADALAEDAAAAVEAEVNGWARAVSAQRADDFFAFYSPDFLPWGFEDRATWEQVRRTQLERLEWIDLQLDGLVVELEGTNTARVTFDQALRSNLYEFSNRKTLTLTLEKTGWKIIEERVQPAP